MNSGGLLPLLRAEFLLGFSFILLRFGCGGETTTGPTLTIGDLEIGRGRERREVQVFALLDALILVGGGEVRGR